VRASASVGRGMGRVETVNGEELAGDPELAGVRPVLARSAAGGLLSTIVLMS